MGFYLNPPADGFEEILKDGLYVDKSELIAYTNQVLGTTKKLTCFSRPRRFGKSFAAKMLVAYYSKGAKSKALFENLKIGKHKNSGFEKHLNNYDVLSLDITSFISVADHIDDTVNVIQKDVIDELRDAFPDCIRENTTSLFKALLQINAKTGKKFFIVIDEWDALFREAKNFIRAVKHGKRKELVEIILQSDKLLDATLKMDAGGGIFYPLSSAADPDTK